MAKRTKNVSTPAVQIPTPAKIESRICLGVAYFFTEEDAQTYAKMVHERGDTYNGGYFHGMSCGREPGRDYTDKALGRLYAVTTR